MSVRPIQVFAKHYRQWLWLFFSLGLGCLLWVSPLSPVAYAQSIDTLRQQQQQIENQRSRLQQQQQNLQKHENTAQQKLQGLRQNIKVTDSQIKASEAKLAAAEKQLQAIERSLLSTEQKFRQQQIATVARLRFLQRQQVDRGWAVLLQSENINEFLTRRYQLKQLYVADRKMLTTLRQQADKVDQQRDQQATKKNEVALLAQQLYAQKAQFERQANSQQSMIARLQSDRRALSAAEAQLEQDSRNIGALIQKKLAMRKALIRGSGRMVFPANGAITSSFGWRVHPILGYQRFHAGIDFGADSGSPIYAADSGSVIFAGWYGGYGNTVIIDHGSGITTLYGHASKLYVTEGQNVQRGQTVAAVGSTGLSTGPHLHFEVRKQGEPVNPAPYL
ncbi:MAG TPA: peptidoglycan DD-metalloendopeptidase family protein [Leptolyngbyaceae cyanobacterium M33_DOE_097]|uniref:Peptidase M23 n=1 Tax=Oscillatoriales cyanobacterium SpSt-418 TaxID=2282169 RepID=A0A7C3KCD7_9CYAN|nr:peptidoglycan DD-metalloendopeptidase family protein [Leptolyngbyaceae cyanobacterium M33_DOE_097]